MLHKYEIQILNKNGIYKSFSKKKNCVKKLILNTKNYITYANLTQNVFTYDYLRKKFKKMTNMAYINTKNVNWHTFDHLRKNDKNMRKIWYNNTKNVKWHTFDFLRKKVKKN